jgi:hypothetical protein
VHNEPAQHRVAESTTPAPPSGHTEADAELMLPVSPPAPPIPANLAAKVTAAISAESARRADLRRREPQPARYEPQPARYEPQPAGYAPPVLPRPRSGQPAPGLDVLIPLPRAVASAA